MTAGESGGGTTDGGQRSVGPGGSAPTLRSVAGPPAAATAVLLALLSGRYGLHGDELYFAMLPPAWWYEDQPPLTVWLTHLASRLGPQTWAQRLPAAAVGGVGVVLAALFPRLLGYGARAQRLAAWSHGLTVYPLIVGHAFLTATIDLLVWQVVILCSTLAVAGRRRALPWAGVAAGLGCWNKLLVLVLVGALVIALASVDRALLRTRHAAAAAVALAVLGGPQLLAQAVHGWPMASVSADLIARSGAVNRVLIPPLAAVFVGLPLMPIAWRGLAWRPSGVVGPGLLGVTAAVVIVLSLLAPAQPYYPAAVMVAALALGWGPALATTARPRRAYATLVAANATVAIVLCLPVQSAGSHAQQLAATLNPVLDAERGWPQLVSQLSSSGQPGDELLVDSYALAGAIARYGQEAGLGRVASGHNALWSLGPPRSSDVVVVGDIARTRRQLFERCEDLGRLRRTGADPFRLAGAPVARCSRPVDGWERIWPHFRRLAG